MQRTLLLIYLIYYIGCPKEKCGFFQISFFSLVVVVVCWCTHFSSSFFFSSKKLRGKNCCIAVSTAAFFVRLSGNGIFFSCLSVFFLTQSPRQNLTSEWLDWRILPKSKNMLPARPVITRAAANIYHVGQFLSLTCLVVLPIPTILKAVEKSSF